VHRDLKPSNLFLPAGAIQDAKILDFGIAWRPHEDARLTETGIALGTPLYMAPEQARGSRELDARADVYALGAVLFECLIGRPPFLGANTMAILCKICLEEPPRLASLLPGVPPALDALVASMLAKDPQGRPPDTMTLAATFADLHPSTAVDGMNVQSPPGALSDAEQRVVCMILIGGRATHITRDDDSSASNAAVAGEADATTDDIDATLSEHGARLERLVDGSMVITCPSTGSATDQAAAMARCALSLRESMVDAPIVVCTGRATVSGRLPMGEVVDRGVALLQGSRTGSVRLDAATAGLLDARFEVKNGDDGVYLNAERELGKDTRTVLGRAVPCLGREAELTMLTGIFATVAGESEARAVVVTAPAGAGKSRLRHELVERLCRGGNHFELLIGRADALRLGSPFGLLAALIREAAGTSGVNSLERRREKLRARLARRLSGDELSRVGEFLGELAGVSFADQPSAALRSARQDARLMGDQMRAAWLDWLTSECSAGPIVMILEDLHWSDAPSVQLLGASLNALADRPLMILALARPEINERHPRLWEHLGAQTFPLTPLARKSCERLVVAVLGNHVPPEVVKRVVRLADGNPFFLEELVRGVAAGEAQLPETVIGMVQTRLDALGPDASRVLRAASIFGDTFHVHGVASLLGPQEEIDVERTIHTLVDREVMQPRVDGAAREYAFRHALVRDASYATLTESDRILGHRLAGAWLENTGESDPMVLAKHFDAGADRARAAVWYAKAGEHALQAEDLEAAISRSERSVACGATGHTLSEISVVEAQARYWRGELAPAAAAARRAVAHEPVGSVTWYHAISELVGVLADQATRDEMVSFAKAALDATPLSPDAVEAQVACLSWTAGALTHDGHNALAVSLMERASTSFAALSAPNLWAVLRFHWAKAILHAALGNVMEAIEQFELALRACDEAGDTRNGCAIRVELSTNWTEVGQPERAEPLVRRALADAKQRSLGLIESFTLPALANVMIGQGRLDEAEAPLAEALEIATKAGSTWSLGLIHFVASTLAHARGNWAESERHARSATEYCSRSPRPAALSSLARALLAQGRKAEAFEASQRATALLDELGSTEFFESFVRLMTAETRMAVGDEAGARLAIAAAQDRIVARAKRITATEFRESFLSRVADNARTLELATSWGELSSLASSISPGEDRPL
jgi:tetratricopeptide (TPR) repeat protein